MRDGMTKAHATHYWTPGKDLGLMGVDTIMERHVIQPRPGINSRAGLMTNMGGFINQTPSVPRWTDGRPSSITQSNPTTPRF
jgi:hypothetical protein